MTPMSCLVPYDSIQTLSVVAAALFSALFATGAAATAFNFESGLAGWTGAGSRGTAAAQGDITASPDDGNFGYVTTDGGGYSGHLTSSDGSYVTGLGLNGEENWSALYSPVFSADAGDELQFFFNYVTTGGGVWADYAWARLLDTSHNQVALLLAAMTNPTILGFDMGSIDATLTPSNAPIQSGSGYGGGPVWEFLGSDSGTCYLASCGFTGWIQANYTFADAGDYILEFGVVNWADPRLNSGLAVDGITITSGDVNSVPEPASLVLLGLGLAGLGALRHRARYLLKIIV
jgi:hypothetical protein